jgi:hypothetical protein
MAIVAGLTLSISISKNNFRFLTPRLPPRSLLGIESLNDPACSAIWEARTWFRIRFEIEAHACDALAGIGDEKDISRREEDRWPRPFLRSGSGP